MRNFRSDNFGRCLIFTVSTWNINGIRARKDSLVDWLASNKPDILFLQEIKADIAKIPPVFSELPDYDAFWNDSTFKGGYSGTGILVKKSLKESLGNPIFSIPEFDAENRIVEAAFKQTVLIGIYTPRGEKDDHYELKLQMLEQLTLRAQGLMQNGADVLICGDFNVAHTEKDVHSSQNKPNATGLRPKERAAIDRLLSAGLIDITRALYPDNSELFTWWPYWKGAREKNLGWRIDCFYVSPQLATRTRKVEVDTEEKSSDHSPVTLVLDFPI
ncbi:exodeoxyribonuclease III [Chloroherpeton thalassium]|uniref:exodeoxyribonuclease III n=1 Tax=Chloroherpeton thalassium TaxID=100716 RepID=UPI001FDEAFE5|nr:exodeoxyribonuclease III [Chloroherpeton thalassium]